MNLACGGGWRNPAKLDRSANMLATLQMIKEKYGGAEGYIKDKCGLTEEDIEQIRKNLIAEVHPEL